MIQPSLHSGRRAFIREIERFQRYARLRSTTDQFTVRRRALRCQRSWPLVIGSHAAGALVEHSAALHDASCDGIGFMTEHRYEANQLVFVRLFWHDPAALWIPAIVRHVQDTSGARLVGTQYAFSDPKACDLAFSLSRCAAAGT